MVPELLWGTGLLRLIQVPAQVPGWQELVADCDQCVPAASLKPRVSHFHLLHLQCPEGNAPNLRDTWLYSSCGTRKRWKRLQNGPVYEQTSQGSGERALSHVMLLLEEPLIHHLFLTGHWRRVHSSPQTCQGVVCASTVLEADGKLRWRTVYRDQVLCAVPPENVVVAVHI